MVTNRTVEKDDRCAEELKVDILSSIRDYLSIPLDGYKGDADEEIKFITDGIESAIDSVTERKVNEVIKDIVKMIDDLESDCNALGDMGTKRWKLFKGVRNNIRDKYEK